MILHRLVSLYTRLREEGKVPPFGFDVRPFHFLIRLWPASGGVELAELSDLRAPPAGKGKPQPMMKTVPIDEEAAKRTVNDAPNLLWDNVEYLFGEPREEGERARARAARRHRLFVEKIAAFIAAGCDDPEVAAVLRFLEAGDFAAVRRHRLWAEMAASGGNIGFAVGGYDFKLVCEKPGVQDAFARQRAAMSGGEARQCLVIGDTTPPARLHPSIKGVRGAQSSGASLVSFNLPAFTSHGLEQGLNAPVGEVAAFAYGAALNRLLSRPVGRLPQHVVAGDTTYVFWASTPHALECAPAALLDPPREAAEDEAPADDRAARDFVSALVDAAWNGRTATVVEALKDDPTPFHVLGLAPNAARLAVRVWHDGTVGDMAQALGRYAEDLTIDGPIGRRLLPIHVLLRGLAVGGDTARLPPALAGAVAQVALTGGRFPDPLLGLALARCRAEQSVTRPRAAVIKGFFRRNRSHLYKDIAVSLDPTNTEVGYLLGRLFAVLERIQATALPGINRTIRDTSFGAASTTPRVIFQRLLKLSQAHLDKMGKDREAFFQIKLGEIINELTPSTGFPSRLSLDQQGLFMIGYYQQRQDFFTAKADKAETVPASE